jgi:hypothetical protein
MSIPSFKPGQSFIPLVFFPNTTRLWNQLPGNIQNSQSIALFWRLLRAHLFPTSPPEWYSYGIHTLNVILSRMRNNCSNLRYDWYINHIVETPSCLLCNWHQDEDANHFFFICPKLDRHRFELTWQVGMYWIFCRTTPHPQYPSPFIRLSWSQCHFQCMEKTGRFES